MKNIFKLLMMSGMSLAVIGCGSETSLQSDVTVNATKSTLSEGNTKLTMDLKLTNNYASNVKVEMKDLVVNVSPCIVQDSEMTPNDFTFENKRTVAVTANLSFTEACVPTSYSIEGTSVLTLDGKTKEIPLNSSVKDLNATLLSDKNGTIVGGVTDVDNEILYRFKNPTPIVVGAALEKRTISIDLIDSLGIGVAGKEISITTLERKFGSISASSIITDASGKATFSYTAPTDFDAVNTQTITVEVIYREKSNYIKTGINIRFDKNSNVEIPSSSPILYQFKNIEPITITRASQTKSITINLVDEYGVGASGKQVQITTLDRKYGSVDSSTVTTNQAGLAIFSYTAPDDISTIDGQSTSVTVRYNEDKKSLSANVSISFKETTDNKDTDNILPIVVIENSQKTIELTTNNKSITISMQVFKNSIPYTEGNVNVELPSKVLNGVDVGLFEAYSVPINSQGIATFNYTGPSNLEALIKNNDLGSTFKFYHTENSALENRQEVKVTYNLEEGSYTPINYVLDVTTDGNDFSMGIPNIEKIFSVVLKNAQGQVINNSDVNISKIEVSTENALVGQIRNTATGIVENSVILKSENNSPFIVISKKLSGIVPIRVSIEFKDINNDTKKLSKIINIRVMSGPPSAISISYVSTGIDASRAKYEEKFAISVTDEYGNKVNTRPYISLGALVGYAVDGSEDSKEETTSSKRLYYGKNAVSDGIANGTVDPLDDKLANTTNFEETILPNVFKHVNNEGANSDKLVIFGQGKNYEAMGKWDFSRINDSTLKLEDDYLGILRDGLSYAIGRNYYQDQCADDGREWLGSTDAESYQLDDEGTVVVSYKYDYHLTGKDALIWVNLSGYQSDTEKNTRIGEVSKHTLRGRGLESRPTAGYSIAKGTTAVVSFDIHHQEVAEWYQNGHFGFGIVANTCANVSLVDSINIHDARSCTNGGVAYVTFKVSAPADKACSFNIQDVVVANEF